MRYITLAFEAVGRLKKRGCGLAILTIARELGAVSDGEELCLCHELGLHCVSKESLRRRCTELGLDQELFSRFDECSPGIAGKLTNSAARYWQLLRTVVMQELLEDNIAFIGRGGNFLMKDLVPCLSIRLVAPMAQRIKRIAAERSISDEEAEKIIRQSDSEREEFCHHYYNGSWSDPANYDLVINTAAVPLEKLTSFLTSLLPESDVAKNRSLLKKSILEQLIKHTIISSPDIQLRFAEISCSDDGVVTIRGSVPSSAASGRIEELLLQIPDVVRVENQLQVVLKDIPSRGR